MPGSLTRCVQTFMYSSYQGRRQHFRILIGRGNQYLITRPTLLRLSSEFGKREPFLLLTLSAWSSITPCGLFLHHSFACCHCKGFLRIHYCFSPSILSFAPQLFAPLFLTLCQKVSTFRGGEICLAVVHHSA